ncbi:CopG family transcriptional regulator [Halovenus rubra]|uniref:CopG family transcriptional regulator n=2 Tax=Halovenus rubra TaxID=869890 RepID=A0ACC7E1J9_9EURY|nr:CopG family transcriptional regulator [Halovenus rubra]
MDVRYTLVCDDDVSQQVSALAREHGVTEEEVLRQLVDIGLDTITEEEPFA